ncbi:hypothetical protein CAPTEDRAFT_105044, partial [Capitella teleta]
KSLNTVPHKLLMLKLSRYGITGNTGAWIRNFLHKRQQTFVVNGCASHAVDL